MSKEKSAGKDRIFSVNVNKGAIETVYAQVAIDDCKENFTEEMSRKMLSDGEVIFSDEFYYASDRSAVAKWEVVPEVVDNDPIGVNDPLPVDEVAEPEAEIIPPSVNNLALAEAGEVLVHAKKGFVGELVEDDENGFKVNYT